MLSLTTLQNLTDLDLESTTLSTDSAKGLSKIPNLTRLILNHVSTDILEPLLQNPPTKLQILQLCHMGMITNKFNLFPMSLTSLDLSACLFVSQDLQSLPRLINLTELKMSIQAPELLNDAQLKAIRDNIYDKDICLLSSLIGLKTLRLPREISQELESELRTQLTNLTSLTFKE